MIIDQQSTLKVCPFCKKPPKFGERYVPDDDSTDYYIECRGKDGHFACANGINWQPTVDAWNACTSSAEVTAEHIAAALAGTVTGGDASKPLYGIPRIAEFLAKLARLGFEIVKVQQSASITNQKLTLKVCPFCKGSNITVGGPDTIPQIMCEDCGGSAASASVWNTRVESTDATNDQVADFKGELNMNDYTNLLHRLLTESRFVVENGRGTATGGLTCASAAIAIRTLVIEREAAKTARTNEIKYYETLLENAEAERNSMQAGLRRLAHPRCFGLPDLTTEEERRRMWYAERIANGGDPYDMQEAKDNWKPPV